MVMESGIENTVFDNLASSRYREVIELFSGEPKSLVDGEGNNLYHHSIKRNDVSALRWLLKNYSPFLSPIQPNKHGQTCFHLACEKDEKLILNTLIEDSTIPAKVWSKQKDKRGHTPLHVACLAGNIMAARKIISNISDEVVYSTSLAGQTALHAAVAAGNISCVRLLAQFKRLVNMTDKYGAPALYYALLANHMDITIQLMEYSKADMDFVTVTGMNIFHAAVASGNLSMTKSIFGKVHVLKTIVSTSTGSTALHLAAGLGSHQILEFLLTQPYFREFINYPNADTRTPAHLAAYRNWPKCLSVLINAYANIHLRDSIGLTVYGIMCNNETQEMKSTFPRFFEELDNSRHNLNRTALQRDKPVKENIYSNPLKKHGSQHVGNNQPFLNDQGNMRLKETRVDNSDRNYQSYRTWPVVEDITNDEVLEVIRV